MLRYLSLFLIFLFISCNKQEAKPKNIILFIGDGMGVSQISALKTVKGTPQMQRFKKSGFVTTHAANRYVTDSAAGATALATGFKSYNKAISVGMDSTTVFKTVLEYAEELGKSTGLVATSGINHATPACFVAHTKTRYEYNEIAKQIAESDVDVIIGGRKANFLPMGGADSTMRKDELDLMKTLSDRLTVVHNDAEFKAIKDVDNLAYLYSYDHPGKAHERTLSLKEMTQKAIEVLSRNDKGFFLMVEGSQIDWGGHANDSEYIIGEILDFDEALGAGLDFAMQDKETLVIVTADHETGGYSLLDGSVDEKKVTKTAFTTTHHSGIMVPVFSYGPQSDQFTGIIDNTDIGKAIISFNQPTK